MGESHPGWTLPSHEGEDEYQDTTSAHREREQRAPTSNRRQHHHGQRRSRNVSEVQTSDTMKDRRRCVVGDRGCSVLWQGFGGSTHFKRRQTRQPVSKSQDAQGGSMGRRRDCAWQALQPFAASLQPDGPERRSTGGAKWLLDAVLERIRWQPGAGP